MTSRELLGEDMYLAWLRDYEQLRAERARLSKGKPDQYTRALLELNKPWERFYKAALT